MNLVEIATGAGAGPFLSTQKPTASSSPMPSLEHGLEFTSGPLSKLRNLQWYKRRLEGNLRNLPLSIAGKINSPFEISNAIASFVKPDKSINDIATHLLDLNLVKSNDIEERSYVAKCITFAVLGWQTMLYESALDTCPPQQLAISDVLDGYTGESFMKFKQDLSRIKRPLPEFLLGFGLMLPPENLCLSGDQEDCQAFEKVAVVGPDELNAGLLKSLARINIKWIDVMAPHLEFDKATNTLFLFRYPSFCMANLPSKEDPNDDSILHRCADQHQECYQWASPQEVSQLLQEILLSYRLLFGQAKASRRLFLSKNDFDKVNYESNDPLLARLCSSKTSPLLAPDRPFYRLNRDFPVLRSRIAILQHQMSNMKPRGWKELWKDKRDSAQWLTFWAVILFGGFGTILSLIQVILQGAQLATSQPVSRNSGP